MSIQFVVAATNLAVLVSVITLHRSSRLGYERRNASLRFLFETGRYTQQSQVKEIPSYFFLVSFNLNCFYDSFHPSVKLNSRLISVSSDRKVLYVGGQLDNSAKVFINTLISNLVHVLYYISMFTHFVGRGK